MADAGDMATEIQAEHLARALAETRMPMSAGIAGECDDCGLIMLRLVGGRCGFCRDNRLPPDDWEPPVINLPTPREEPPAMPAKSIQLPAHAAVAIAAVEARARTLSSSQGEAAADLIVAGSQTIDAENGARTPLSDFELEELFAEIANRIHGTASPAFIDALSARAEAAEAKLAQIQAAFD